MNERVVTLENRITVMEREDRKNNILIKGLDVASEEQLQCPDVEVSIESKLKTKAKLTAIREIKRNAGQRMMITRCETFEQKLQIIKAKNRLNWSQCFTENDLTREERKTQAILRNMARGEKEKGKGIKVGYKKLIIDGEIWDWKGEENRLVRKQTKKLVKYGYRTGNWQRQKQNLWTIETEQR